MPIRCSWISTNHRYSHIRQIFPRQHPYHTSSARRNVNASHYETLGVDRQASTTAIKRKFYALSKRHHPDCNRNDPDASSRFVKISEAYAVLGNPEKRTRYDRETQPASSVGPNEAPKGSYSSSAPYGARPASGLSRRRTQFRGPPPSFYHHGGWGTQWAKRRSKAGSTRSGLGPTPNATSPNFDSAFPNGTKKGEDWSEAAYPGFENDVPHFDHISHYRTQEQQDQRRKGRIKRNDAVGNNDNGDIAVKFFFVSTVVLFAWLSFPAKDRNRTWNNIDG